MTDHSPLSEADAANRLMRLAKARSRGITGCIMPRTPPEISDAEYDALVRRNAAGGRVPASDPCGQPQAAGRARGGRLAAAKVRTKSA
ncbi:MAG: hypothetical protein LKM31_04925 [Sphingobium sp.]|nr:hypothetical protein [Sphingobium sp.]